MGQAIDLGTIEVELPPGYEESKRLASIARVRLWERNNRERYLAARQARYRTRHERVCKGIADESCILLLTGTRKQRCNLHAYLRDLEVRRERRQRKAAG
jgi:hypothetical protein